AETNFRLKTLMEETEMLRGFADASPFPIWAKGAKGNLNYDNTAYVLASEAVSVSDAVERHLELIDSTHRAEMERSLAATNAYNARLPIVTRGARRIYDAPATHLRG